MRVIIAGSRTVTRLSAVRQAIIDSGFNITEVVSGGAAGVDRLGERWARINSVPVKRFPAAWRDRDGCVNRGAGMIRNRQMGEYAEALIAVWDGESPGTKDMIEVARKAGLVVFVATPAMTEAL